MNAARIAYARYCQAVGGPFPTFYELDPKQQNGWKAAGESAGMNHAIGDPITTKTGAKGVVSHITRSKSGAHGYWFEGTDSTGRPFEAHAFETDVIVQTATAAA